MNYEKEGNRISFTTDSFSNFGLGVKSEGKPFEPGKPSEPGKPNVPGQNDKPGNTDNKPGQSDKTNKTVPTKTGESLLPIMVASIVLVSAMILLVLRKKVNKN